MFNKYFHIQQIFYKYLNSFPHLTKTLLLQIVPILWYPGRQRDIIPGPTLFMHSS